MKRSLLLGIFLLPLVALGETAYEALRVVGSQRDAALLNRVVEVRGRSGTPQPEVWTILLDDPKARGGIRELEISSGQIVSERTPVRTYAGSTEPINFERLNLDSSGAFTLAEEEARRARVSFDSVDYVLRRDDDRSAPAWHLQLLDTRKQTVGTLVLAADNGAIVARNFDARPRFRDDTGVQDIPPPRDDSRYVGVPPPPAPVATVDRYGPGDDGDDDDGGVKGAIKEGGKRVGRTINKTFHRVGGSLQEFFTGKRTYDREYRD